MFNTLLLKSLQRFTHITMATIIGLFFIVASQAQTVKVGSGSYTTAFPGTDIAGRNGYPSGTPYLIDSLKTKPIPTNDWWSAKLKNAHCDNLFNYPLTMKTVNSGLVVSYIPWGVISDIERWGHFTQSQRAIHFALQRLAHHHGMERRLTKISSHRGHGHAVHLLPKRRQQRG